MVISVINLTYNSCFVSGSVRFSKWPPLLGPYFGYTSDFEGLANVNMTAVKYRLAVCHQASSSNLVKPHVMDFMPSMRE